MSPLGAFVLAAILATPTPRSLDCAFGIFQVEASCGCKTRKRGKKFILRKCDWGLK